MTQREDGNQRRRWETEKGEQGFAYLAAKRRALPEVFSLQVVTALAAGEHVHVLDDDGEWCLSDCEVPMRTGLRGYEVDEFSIIYDETPDWKDTA